MAVMALIHCCNAIGKIQCHNKLPTKAAANVWYPSALKIVHVSLYMTHKHFAYKEERDGRQSTLV